MSIRLLAKSGIRLRPRPDARWVNYIGSKKSLLAAMQPFFVRVKEETSGTPALLDIFAGTGIVSQFGRSLGFDATANDIQCYSVTTATALLADPAAFSFLDLANGEIDASRPTFGLPGGKPLAGLDTMFFRDLETISPAAIDHPFVAAYVEGGAAGRLYLSKQNGRTMAAARDRIEQMRAADDISPLEHALLVASLLEGIDKVANTASVYGAYLKQVKRSAQQPFRFALPLLFDGLTSGSAIQGDANASVRALTASGRSFDLMYVDPPYNERQYSSNYHLLETIARWDLASFEPRGKTGLRPADEGRSPYCSKKTVAGAVSDLIENAPARNVLFSYNNEGLLPREELEEIFFDAGYEPVTTEVSYKRFRADRDHENRSYSGDETTEYLIFATSR